MLEPRCITLHHRAQFRLAGAARQRQLVGECLEVQIVALAAAVHAKA
jgi:hypothetical protein